MNETHVTETLTLIPLSTVLLISFLAGLLQSASPDRWIPLSIHSWQRGWDVRRTLLAGAGLLSAHVALGGVLYGVISLVAAPVSSESLSLVAVAVVLGGAVLLGEVVTGPGRRLIRHGQRPEDAGETGRESC